MTELLTSVFTLSVSRSISFSFSAKVSRFKTVVASVFTSIFVSSFIFTGVIEATLGDWSITSIFSGGSGGGGVVSFWIYGKPKSPLIPIIIGKMIFVFRKIKMKTL